jgi:subtilisin family serine protease
MKTAFLVILIFVQTHAFSQYSRYIISLTDKKGTPHQLSNPSTFLSPKSITKRTKFNINLDSTDLPVSKIYLDSILQAGKVTLINTSKWLNQVLIQTTDAQALSKISSFTFVKKRQAIAFKPSKQASPDFIEEITDLNKATETTNSNLNSLQYGNSGKQIQIHEGEYLHNLGFKGQNVSIAVLDGGFFNYNAIKAFDSVRSSGRIKATWDFVDNNNQVQEDDPHGMYCFSILAANLPGVFVGSAPEADYYLYRTEDVKSEFPVEEQNWIAAAEKADSLGIDIISSSLGYTTFDDPAFNYGYNDMNGKNTIVTRGAALASRKGILVMNSAGNSGTNSWKFIGAPADGEQVLAVGAVNITRQVAPFSSYGPTFDQRIKPDVVSVGWGTALINGSGLPASGNGTSFSNPNIAGLIACLWQAFPEMRNNEIIEAVRKSGDMYANPDSRSGYGLPNMQKAYGILEIERVKKNAASLLRDARVKAFPNPFENKIQLVYKAPANGKIEIRLTDLTGRLIFTESKQVIANEIYVFDLENLGILKAGPYIITYSDVSGTGSIKLVK